MDQEEYAGSDSNDQTLLCRDYSPIAAVTNLVPDQDAAEADETGCDSCLHWQSGRCLIYAGER